MKTSAEIEQDLVQLGEELGTQPDLAWRVLDEFRSGPASRMPPESTRRAWFSPRAVVAAVVMGLILSLAGWRLAAPAALYGRVTAAVERAKTVHVTGWTRSVIRKWPLESPSREAPGAEVRHPVEAWFWFDPKGQSASYEKFGPVISVRRGGSLREYQEDVRLLFIFDSDHPKNSIDRISCLAEHLKALDGPNVTKQELGTRAEGVRTLKGCRVTRHGRVEEFWIDAGTDLPARLSAWQERPEGKVPILELTFAFDQPIPDEIVRYEPPQTKNIRYGGANNNAQLAWRQHVQEIGRRLQSEPIRNRVALLPRENGRTFDLQWEIQTPDGQYWVMPIDDGRYSQGMSLSNFIKNRAGTRTGDRRHGTWRVPKEFQQLEIPRQDLVYQEGTDWHEWVNAVLGRFDLECVDVVEERTVWIARHDGRKLKPWQNVKPPVPYIVEGGLEKKGMVKPGIGFKLVPVTMDELLDDFNMLIDCRDFTAKRPIIFDETGLSKPPSFDPEKFKTAQEFRDTVVVPGFGVATDSPWFVGEESIVMARDWYQKEFGITMTEESRQFTVHVVRRKAKTK